MDGVDMTLTMRNNLSTNILCFVTGIIILSMITKFNAVDCRALRCTQLNTNTINASTAAASIITSFNNTTSVRNLGLRMRDLSYKLASGPSRRGAGH
ncbi:hypothetical protein OSB04_002847 [Centaurea solstitialis]|uniref:Uncharacterized protein n=1 Tax=Centaurea solstitialis TaxID=347529 RepID=A0AA38U691_9ASTR|nr:hypothetical protein OSB04_002847 [Centaurea solstitialis]